MKPLTLPAPAKLNLFLHITGRRPDGYHDLQTVFQFIDRADLLHFSPRGDGVLTLTPSLPGVADDDNLILRAARLLQHRGDGRDGADIRLEKQLPMGGGLGGGSSDAATTLLALNTLWGLNLDLDTLATLGLQLGADVPVFVRGHAAWAEGVGERLTPVDLPEPWYLVLCPPAHVSTAEAFAHPELTRDTPPITLRAFLDGAGRNDFEKVVCALSPAVETARNWLAAQGSARMTGTGACLFKTCTSRSEAEQLLSKSPVAGFVTRGYNASPAHTALRQYLRMHHL
ncbi:4-(cytidine 5'-diphospho)-2-C-methyl-D-erythritol kinase [Perlucidibaca piscinae]|uniref:4-(cytidine 5'-diphospho)-2-C-methyl-D-erythritol kinase n=1 Tax=Perlucidibaca piscinae TaxID=392589 RepID=UPI00040DF622|nr:4-(cytidine 5'-diphospho)-2-C-methyl-D-erythritol kinase [Perlucidibaca piscinae]